MAHPHALLPRRLWAVFRRTRLFRAVAGAGEGRGSLQCDRHELDPVQPGAGPRPALGGLAYTSLGATWCFALNGISYIAVILSLFMIQVKFVPPTSRESMMKSMGEGIRFIRQPRGVGSAGRARFLYYAARASPSPVFCRSLCRRSSTRDRRRINCCWYLQARGRSPAR